MRMLFALSAALFAVAVVESRHYRRVEDGGLRRWGGSGGAAVGAGLSRDRRRAPKRDLVRERAQANYQKVVQELNDKFRNLIEGCYPRPRGCLCVVGTDGNGRDVTERRRNQADCVTTDPSRLEAGRAVHDNRDRKGANAPDYGQRGRTRTQGGLRRRRRHHARRH